LLLVFIAPAGGFEPPTISLLAPPAFAGTRDYLLSIST